MPKLNANSVPSYRLHRQSGQAIVTLNGRDNLLGTHGTAASKAEYNRRIAEWIANGRRLPQAVPDLSIGELIARYREHAGTYYRHPDGTPTSEVDNIRQAMKPLRLLYGKLAAAEFSPLKLQALRETMMHPIEGRGWSRKNINRAVNRIRGMFKWAAASELAPASVHHGFLTSTVKAMIQLQRLTGARPGEICTMRIGDLQRTGEVWTYRLQQHKTQHHGRQRAISIGPRAQHVLKPFLLRIDPSAYIFSPADAVAEMRQRRSENRKTPIGHGNRRGTNVKRRPKRTPSTSYDVAAYRRAITRACDVADVWAKGGQIVANDERIISRWHPHQLRHTAATDIRRQFGLEAAQHVLGHASVDMTQVYAERNQEIARAVAAKIG